jgi:hypothetical protein
MKSDWQYLMRSRDRRRLAWFQACGLALLAALLAALILSDAGYPAGMDDVPPGSASLAAVPTAPAEAP